jgi:hypothetical protein
MMFSTSLPRGRSGIQRLGYRHQGDAATLEAFEQFAQVPDTSARQLTKGAALAGEGETV